MAEYLDIERWHRQKQFQFFSPFEQPFFHLCAPVEVDRLVQYIKEKELSFARAILYLCLKCANQITEFRYRKEEDRVRVYPEVHGSCTFLNQDESYGTAFLEYGPSYRNFAQKAGKAMTPAANCEKNFAPQDDRHDVIHFSILPWLSFTSIHNPRHTLNSDDSIPKVVIGRYQRHTGGLEMPLSIAAHHALMDGLHAARYYQKLADMAALPEEHLES